LVAHSMYLFLITANWQYVTFMLTVVTILTAGC
jgi:hypothetical protein